KPRRPESRLVSLRVTAVRHGESTLNASGRITGELDPPLTALGCAQAHALAARLATRRFDLIVHSGSRRTAQTLRALDATPAQVDVRWRERAFGVLAGAPREAWRQPPDIHAAPLGGESYSQLARRVHAALSDLGELAWHADPAVLLCAHSG